ncbi:mitochondrial 54S ribosomal protein uL22m [Kwoniella dejecticola CBS 10117]|uniref:50S small subunit ribosomal protein L22 n=1 Tax=Kwoniella dejecticola CBS 10117 TaxID=1296121 RepID=A0A1A6A0A5_9TREE|nr:50S small subunit ribosomal protein L22 [Kwoniella dejecticola CBS 10117]OBR83495.1 50S small subunit ribosomal protein L22 [Kwoniella dejecticola CBS 10117]
MARPLRSLFTVAQTSIAGPSSLRPVTSHLRPSNQVRTAFNLAGWDRYLPKLPRWTSEEDQPKDEATGGVTMTEEKGAGVTTNEDASTGGLFDEYSKEAEEDQSGMKKRKKRGDKPWTEHKYSSALHKISHRKLNDLSRQISDLPIDEAIVQMQFSEKRASKWIKSTLALSRDHAVDKGLNRSKLVVAETWVSKGPKIARLDIKGRGKYGIKHHPSSKIHVLLKEGKTPEEKLADKFAKDLRKVRSAGVVREDGKIRRKVISGWTW